jgi:hypothetical protein
VVGSGGNVYFFNLPLSVPVKRFTALQKSGFSIDEEKMNFGPAEMAQMMDGARSLLTVTMVSSVGIGLVLGVIVARFRCIFFEGDCIAIEPSRA